MFEDIYGYFKKDRQIIQKTRKKVHSQRNSLFFCIIERSETCLGETAGQRLCMSRTPKIQ